MKIIFDTVDVIDEQPVAVSAPPRPRKRAGLHSVQAFGVTYGMMIAGIAILLSEVVLRTGGNVAGSNVVLLGTLLIAILVGIVVVSVAERSGIV
jgi:hypothetical protein